MTYDEILEAVSWDAVTAIFEEHRLPQMERQDVMTMLTAALRKWGPDDLDRASIEAIEQLSLVEVPENLDFPAEFYRRATPALELQLVQQGRWIIKLFADLTLTTRQSKFRQPERRVIDWKTAGSLNAEWRDRLAHSWQARLYSWALQADTFVYRGVQRDGRTSEVRLPWPQFSRNGYCVYGPPDCANYVRQAFELWNGCRRNSGPWVQHMPFACKAYGRPCEHIGHCDEKTAPAGVPAPKALSYTVIENFLLCPERARLNELLANDGDADERTRVGKAFHAAIAEVYRQLTPPWTEGTETARPQEATAA